MGPGMEDIDALALDEEATALGTPKPVHRIRDSGCVTIQGIIRISHSAYRRLGGHRTMCGSALPS